MKNTYLVEKKEGIFSKIKRFFQRIFIKEKLLPEHNEEQTQNVKKLNKEEFMDLYRKVKNEEIDYTTLDEDTIDMLCELLKEEILIRAERIDEINSKKVK